MKFFSSLLVFIFLSTQAFAGATMNGCSDDYSSLVFDAKTQNILSETRSDKIAYPASLTKLMTLYLTFEALKAGKIKLSDVIIVSQRGEEISKINKSTTLHLKEGDKITVEQAIKGSIVKSFNEASISLAEIVAGDEWQFARKMNEKAFELGMFNTSFRNSTGFHEDGQYTTAYDLARLTIALRKDFPQFYPLFALRTFEYKGRKFETHNHVLVEYEGAEGMKTGYTKAAGYNLISAAKKPFDKKNKKAAVELDQRVISIVMGCASIQSRDNFVKKSLDSGFDNIKSFGKNAIVSKVNSGFDYGEVGVENLEAVVAKADVVSEEVENEKSSVEEVKPVYGETSIEAPAEEVVEVKDKKFVIKKEKENSKNESGKLDVKKSEAKKSEVKKAEVKKGKVEVKKLEVKKSDSKKEKSAVKKSAVKKEKSESKKTEVKKVDKKSESKKKHFELKTER